MYLYYSKDLELLETLTDPVVSSFDTSKKICIYLDGFGETLKEGETIQAVNLALSFGTTRIDEQIQLPAVTETREVTIPTDASLDTRHFVKGETYDMFVFDLSTTEEGKAVLSHAGTCNGSPQINVGNTEEGGPFEVHVAMPLVFTVTDSAILEEAYITKSQYQYLLSLYGIYKDYDLTDTPTYILGSEGKVVEPIPGHHDFVDVSTDTGWAQTTKFRFDKDLVGDAGIALLFSSRLLGKKMSHGIRSYWRNDPKGVCKPYPQSMGTLNANSRLEDVLGVAFSCNPADVAEAYIDTFELKNTFPMFKSETSERNKFFVYKAHTPTGMVEWSKKARKVKTYGDVLFSKFFRFQIRFVLGFSWNDGKKEKGWSGNLANKYLEVVARETGGSEADGYDVVAVVSFGDFRALGERERGAINGDYSSHPIKTVNPIEGNKPYKLKNLMEVATVECMEDYVASKLEGKLDVPDRPNYDSLVGFTSDGTVVAYDLKDTAEPGSVPRRNADGTFEISEPLVASNPATKSYVDNADAQGRQYAEQESQGALDEAKTYSDGVLAQAKAYTDQKTQGLLTTDLPITFGSGDGGIKGTNAAFFYQIPASIWSTVTPAEDAFVGIKAQAGFLSLVMVGKFTLKSNWITSYQDKWLINIGYHELPSWVRNNLRLSSDFNAENRYLVAQGMMYGLDVRKSDSSEVEHLKGTVSLSLKYNFTEESPTTGNYQIFVQFHPEDASTAPTLVAGDEFYINCRVLLDVMAGNSASENATE